MTKSEFSEPSYLCMLKELGRLNKLLGDVVISQGGVVPHINPEVCDLQLKRRGPLLIHYPSAPAQQNPEG